MKSASEHKIDVAIGNLLRTGVVLAASVVFVGAVLYLVRDGESHVNYGMFHGERADLRSVRAVAQESFQNHARAIMQLGILLLLATPFARVLFSVFVFLKQKDWIYTAFTLVVLGILAYSLFGR